MVFSHMQVRLVASKACKLYEHLCDKHSVALSSFPQVRRLAGGHGSYYCMRAANILTVCVWSVSAS